MSVLFPFAGKKSPVHWPSTHQPAGLPLLKLPPGMPPVGIGIPPLPVSTDDCPAQIVVGFAVAVTGCCGMILTTAVLE